MTDAQPIACTLGESDLRQRLDEIVALGAESLLDYEETMKGHVLHFRNDADTRRRLERIVTAEAKCCPFLDLQISERANELLLAIDATGEGQALAGQLASAFSAMR